MIKGQMEMAAGCGWRLAQRPLFTLLLLAWLFTGAQALQAQGGDLAVAVDKTAVTTDETIELTITLSGSGSLPQPEIPALDGFQRDGFQVVSSGRSLQTTIANGSISTAAVYTYRLQPLEVGELTIGPVTAVIDGQTHTTDPITISITQGSQPIPAPGADPNLGRVSAEDFFMVAEVDNPNPYVGQSIIYSVRIFQRGSFLGRVPLDLPNFVGFWNQETTEGTYVAQVEDDLYRVIEFQSILYPQFAGDLTIDPAKLDLTGAMEQDNLHTEAVTVVAKPLPQPQPADFKGAVGQFTLEAQTDKTEVAVGEAIRLQVAVKGWGNLEGLPPPELPQPDGWRPFDLTTSTNGQEQNGRFWGTRLYQQIFVPQTSGDVVISPITYTFFDPLAETYQTVQSDPVTVRVTGSATHISVLPTAVGHPTPASETSRPEAAPDPTLQPLRPLPAVLSPALLSLAVQPLYWVLWVVPLLLLASLWGWQRWQEIRREIPARQRPLFQARQILAQARQLGGEPYRSGEQALLTFLSQKLAQPLAGLTRADRLALLQNQGLDAALVGQVDELLLLAENGRFAPSGSNGTATGVLDQTQALIEQLDKALTAAESV